VLEWKDPPESRVLARPNSEYIAIADELRAHTGQWARIKANVSGTSLPSDIKKGRIRAFRPAGTFEAVVRRGAIAKRWDVFVRYVGESDQDITPDE
jgi:hypothetical protein